ncbi:MAG: ATP-binding protein [Candidatus Omnitrophota bacterium]|nr:ATP-binding protein [Candidatus Omnitrophota bacterium]
MLVNLLSHKNKNKELTDTLKAIAASNTIKELFHTSLNKTLEFLGAERGSILLFDLTSRELTLKIARGQEENLNRLGNTRQKIGEGIAGMVAQEKKPLLVRNVNRDRRFKNNHNRLNHYKTNSFLSIPLFMRETLIGVINITDKTSKKAFSAEDMNQLLILSSFISIVFERIKLLDETKEIISSQDALINTQLGKIERLRFEKNELDKQLNLAKKFASLGKISSGIAHEINNPLDGVIRYTNLCLERVKEDITAEYLHEIKGGLNRIADIIRSLLEFSRHDPMKKSPIDVNKTLDESLALMNKNLSIKNNAVVIKNYGQNLPKITDKGIKHVFTNLIKNACEAMEEGGTLKITTHKEATSVKIKISDTGCGIPQESINQVFEPFFTTKSIEKGAGLGLAICYDVIERYHGNISLESGIGKGSTFTITIPSENIPNEHQ